MRPKPLNENKIFHNILYTSNVMNSFVIVDKICHLVYEKEIITWKSAHNEAQRVKFTMPACIDVYLMCSRSWNLMERPTHGAPRLLDNRIHRERCNETCLPIYAYIVMLAELQTYSSIQASNVMIEPFLWPRYFFCGLVIHTLRSKIPVENCIGITLHEEIVVTGSWRDEF